MKNIEKLKNIGEPTMKNMKNIEKHWKTSTMKNIEKPWKTSTF